jgi:hypothetical protein
MVDRRIQPGQIWKKDDSGETFIVTKVFTEALATYAVLRKTGAESESRLRVKVTRTAEGQSIVGFSLATGTEDF